MTISNIQKEKKAIDDKPTDNEAKEWWGDQNKIVEDELRKIKEICVKISIKTWTDVPTEKPNN